MKKIFSFLLIGLALIGIFLWVREDSSQNTQIQDLKAPQDAMLYAKEMPNFQSKETLQKLKEDYLKQFFAPFVDMSPNLNTNEVFWVLGILKKNSGYKENLLPRSQKETEAMIEKMQTDSYPNALQKAIITKDTNARVVPSIHPRFSNPNGYPFDRWQNSLLFYGTPVLITHYDTSGRFAHIQTEFVGGWVEVSDLALVSDQQVKELLKIKHFVMPNNDNQSLKDRQNRFITPLRIGKLFMLDSQGKMLIFHRMPSGALKISKETISLQDFHPFPQEFSQIASASYINTLMGQSYGWGGLYEGRDCSSLLRDVLGNFGLYLPRNSKAQAYFGHHQIKLEDLDLSHKEKAIVEKGTPFATLIWFRGHIMLYIGTNSKGEPMVAHSGWSVQSSNIFGKKKHKLGGVVITSLKPANEHNGYFFSSPTLGDHAKIMNDLSPYLKGQSEQNP